MYLNQIQSTGGQNNSSVVQCQQTQQQIQHQQQYYNNSSCLNKQTKNNSNIAANNNFNTNYQPYDLYATHQILNGHDTNNNVPVQSETGDLMISLHLKQIDDQQKCRSNNSTFIDHLISPNNVNHQSPSHQSINLLFCSVFIFIFVFVSKFINKKNIIMRQFFYI